MDKVELNWVAYLIGKIGEDELLPENHERLAEHKREREDQRKRGWFRKDAIVLGEWHEEEQE